MKRVREMRSRGLSYSAICAILNLEGIMSKKGGKWNPPAILRICKEAK